jgi:hypothetical protein
MKISKFDLVIKKLDDILHQDDCSYHFTVSPGEIKEIKEMLLELKNFFFAETEEEYESNYN